MQVVGAYILVVLVWSTTPLAIHLSNSSLSFVSAITVRMLIAFTLCYALLRLLKQPLIQHRRDLYLFAVCGIGLFPNMLLVYWVAQYLPSGLMSVIMGVYPFFVGLFSILILRENPFNLSKIVGLLLAVVGLLVVHQQQLQINPKGAIAMLVMLFVCSVWGISTVLVKKLGAEVSALRQGTGSMAFALPLFLAAWLVLDGKIPEQVGVVSIYSVLYLVIMGSVIGHTLWFYVLKKCTAISVSIITLITPMLAISWGILFADESFSSQTLVGVITIVVALILYQGMLAKLVGSTTRLMRCTKKWVVQRKERRALQQVSEVEIP